MITFPTIQIVQQSTTVDPSGFRHQSDPSKGFIKSLGTGAGQFLDFGTVNNLDTTVISDTKCIYYRASSLGDASGIFNLRFFLNDISAFGEGTYRFLEEKSLEFQSGKVLTAGADDIPTTVPANPNVKTTRSLEFPLGGNVISGILDDSCTQYIYLSVLVQTDVPIGQYGTGGWTMRLLYDFS